MESHDEVGNVRKATHSSYNVLQPYNIVMWLVCSVNMYSSDWTTGNREDISQNRSEAVSGANDQKNNRIANGSSYYLCPK